MGWLTWAIDDPAPADHCGYSFLNVPCELADPSLRRGNTVHSVEGWFTYANPSAVMAARGSSWGVTIMRSGQVWRHRPRPTFVNWHAGGPAQNIGTDGIEMEGKDQPWTPEQKASLLRVLKETWEWFGWTGVTLGCQTDRTQEGIRRALLAGSLWEHRWFDYTSCPSGRNEWSWLISALEEDVCKNEAEFMELFDKAVKERGIPRDSREGGVQKYHAWATLARIADTIWNHMGDVSKHGADSGGQTHDHEVALPAQTLEVPRTLVRTSKAG